MSSFIEKHERGNGAGVSGEIQVVVKLILLIVSLMTAGTIGFSAIEGWSILDSFFMTVITISTVGFGEVHPLGPSGKVFACVLIFAGVGIAAYSFTFVTQSIVAGEIRHIRGNRKMRKSISALKGHTIVCGFGRLGSYIAEGLAKEGIDVVVVENDPGQVRTLTEKDALVIMGNAYEDKTLIDAGIENAKNILAVLPRDADNLYIVLCARELNSGINIIARAESAVGEKRLRRAGANNVIAPYSLSGARVVRQIARPNVSNFLEIAESREGAVLVLEEMVVPRHSHLCGKTLADSHLRDRTGIMIAAFISPSGEMTFNPHRDSVIEAESTMIVLGKRSSIEKLTEIVESERSA